MCCRSSERTRTARRRDRRFDEEHREPGADGQHRADEQPCDLGAQPGADEVRSEQHDDDQTGQDRRRDREPCRPADQRHPAVEDLEAAIQRSCSAPRLASSIGSMSRVRSTIRDSREASTLRNAPMPLSRNTGASARRTISATVLTDRSASFRTSRRMHRYRAAVSRPRFAAGDFEQHQPGDDEARRQDPGEAGDQRRGRPEQADDDRRDRQAGDEQHGQKQVHRRRDGHPAPADAAVDPARDARITLRISSQPMIGTTVGKNLVSGLIRNSRPASTVTPPAAIARSRASRRSEPAIALDQPGRDEQARRSRRTRRLCSTGRSAAPAPSRMIARPATRIPRARLRSASR